MLACQGTTKEEALENQGLRETIIQDKSVTALFTTFQLEDGSGKCTINGQKAFEHVRHVLNELRRKRKGDEMDTGATDDVSSM